MATTLKTIEQYLERMNGHYEVDAVNNRLIFRTRFEQYSFVVVVKLDEGGTLLKLMVPKVVTVQNHPHQEAALQALLAMGREVKLVRWQYDPSDGEIRATIDISLEDGELTQRQFQRSLQALVSVLGEVAMPRLQAILQTGQDPGLQKGQQPGLTEAANPQRFQDYWQLIQRLLNCASGQEAAILQSQPELVDQGLVLVMIRFAEQLQNQGNARAAGWVKSMAGQIAEATKSTSDHYSSSKIELDDPLNFVASILRLIEGSGSRKKIVYQFLSEHQSKLNAELLQTFPLIIAQFRVNTEKMGKASVDAFAALLGNFGNLIAQFPLGNRAINLELAIEAHKWVLHMYTHEAFPVEWANAQNSLAAAYIDRIQGNRAENLELAIKACEQALRVYTREAFPENWAMTQYNFASACYKKHIQGDRAENIELAIEAYEQALQVFTREGFPVEWANAQNNLAVAYRNRIRGNRAENLELAIQACKQALQVFTYEAFPENWAMTQNNLATAYIYRIRGDRAENLELAIQACEQALQVYTHEAFPENWAMTQTNLAIAYSERIREGGRTENLELSIEAYKRALQVYTREVFPEMWATAQNNLANAYKRRIRGDRAENLELAIEACEQALQVTTREAFPEEWAMTQNNLANIYRDRIRGDKPENLELAIEIYNQALQVRTRENRPEEWAMTQNNLAIAYNKRICGDQAENQELAIQANEQALQVYTHENFPVEWARLQRNLANAYTARIRGDRAENLELAIQDCKQALQIFTREAFPEEWAMTQNSLATAYRSRIEGDRSENLELAIQACEQEFQVYTRDAFPEGWAMLQHNLANTYMERVQGDRAENIELAIEAYEQALQVFNPATFPLRAFGTGRLLGNVAFTVGRWHLAIQSYTIAIEAVEQGRGQAMTEERRQEIVAEAIDVYQKMVQACINNGQLDLALETVERSRSRRLADLMARQNYQKDVIPSDVRQYLAEYDAVQQQINEIRLRSDKESQERTPTRNRVALAADNEQIQQLETQKRQIYAELNRLDPVSAGTLQANLPNLERLKKLLTSHETALLSFYTTTDHTHIFILKQDQLDVFTCTGQGLSALQIWLQKQWQFPYLLIAANRKKQWLFPHLLVTDNGQEKRASLTQMWQMSIPIALQQLSDRLQLGQLVQQHLQGIHELIIVPHLLLHQIPFSALPLTTSEGKSEYLGDRFLIRYAPSTQVLGFCSDRPAISAKQYGTVENATEDLPYARLEGEYVATLLEIPSDRRLQGRTQATVKNYRQLLESTEGIISSHHAQSRIDDPLASRLILADGEITLGQLLTPGWRFPQLSDIFLSCCETGLGAVKDLTDDILTLSTGFLCAGARSVISTFWAVDDLATMMFSIFYHDARFSSKAEQKQEQSQEQGGDRLRALHYAQRQLRTLTRSELQARLQTWQQKIEEQRLYARKQHKQQQPGSNEALFWQQQQERYAKLLDDLLDIDEKLAHQFSAEEHPFADPYYWAAFKCEGLG